jgi:hypothetical protein
MTTKQINNKIEKLTIELNKVKTYATKLAKKLIENKIDVPTTNWSEQTEK